jgi:hypothetical protein
LLSVAADLAVGWNAGGPVNEIAGWFFGRAWGSDKSNAALVQETITDRRERADSAT